MITVRIKFNQFNEFPPYLGTYLTAVELIGHGIPLDLTLNNIILPPSLIRGYLTTCEDFINNDIVYTWEDDDE
tara:strand:- start:3351 stop:3569 length:219 start_codon:yes stop_codon:yes gene_type:complete